MTKPIHNESHYDDYDYEAAREVILKSIEPLPPEVVPLSGGVGRVLAEDVIASADVPPFDRSPYDGYAFRAEDTEGASQERPVTLRIIEEVRAGDVPHLPVTPGTAVKILTGAPIPDGADSVVPFERTRFTPEEATLFAPSRPGDNIVRAGEDVKRGTVLARAGDLIAPGTAGVLAAQGVQSPLVFRKPRVGVLSTGSELQELGRPLEAGRIYNSNRYAFEAALSLAGCEPLSLGVAEDGEGAIAERLKEGLASCDALILTGGVSVGDYDRTPAALEAIGARMAVRDVRLKPGGKCAYAFAPGPDGGRERLVCALSGNPASAMTNYYAVALPALRKLAGRRDFLPVELDVALEKPFGKRSPQPRLLRGKLKFIDGRAVMDVAAGQGNAVLSGMIGCDVMALIPAGSDALPAGTKLRGFLI